MKNYTKINIIIAACITSLFLSSITINGNYNYFFEAYAQNTSSSNNATSNSKPLPVLLIHGYLADASMWNKWQDLLKKDGILSYPITFNQSDDKCGSAAEHAKELSSTIAKVKSQSGQSKVNIVGHSKGGLDARVYLANGTQDVANLIMIGTPNAGSPLAENNNICAPAVYDLKPGAPDTTVKMNPNTKYYTIAGDWNPSQGNCDMSFFSLFEQGSSSTLPKPNDGMVPVSSVESLGYSNSLGHSKSCHSNLLSEYEYGLAKNILLEKR
jgi:pimeloyl-ACP methyl ester carboxylesterase